MSRACVAVAEQVATAGTVTAAVPGRITQQVAKLMRMVTRILGRLKSLFGSLGDVLGGLGRFGRGASGAPAAGFEGLEDVGRRMEDWGDARPTLGDVGSEVADAGRQFGRAYGDAGNTWNKATENVTVRKAEGAQGAVDAYTPFKPITRRDGTVSPHSVPSVGDGAFHTKLAADTAREASKEDELRNEGVPDEQRDVFRRQTGYLDE